MKVSACLQNKKCLYGILLASLCLNVFGGAAIGGALMGSKLPLLLFAHNHMESLLAYLPDEKRDAVEATVKQQLLPDLVKQLDDQLTLRTKLADIIEKPTVSTADLEDEFSQLRQGTTHMQMTTQKHFTDIIMSLSPEDRILLAKGLRTTFADEQKMLRRMEKRRGLTPKTEP